MSDNKKDVVEMAALAGALAGVFSVMDFNDYPGLADALVPLRDILQRKLSSTLRHGPVIHLDQPQWEGPSV